MSGYIVRVTGQAQGGWNCAPSYEEHFRAMKHVKLTIANWKVIDLFGTVQFLKGDRATTRAIVFMPSGDFVQMVSPKSDVDLRAEWHGQSQRYHVGDRPGTGFGVTGFGLDHKSRPQISKSLPTMFVVHITWPLMFWAGHGDV